MKASIITCSLFSLFFIIFPFFHAVLIRNSVFKQTLSASRSLAVSLMVTPILNCAFLTICYFFVSKQNDVFYLTGLTILNVALAICSLSNLKKTFFTLREEIYSLPNYTTILTGILITFFITTMLIIPMGNDILEYFEIGRVFYREKSLFYPVLPFYSENLFDSHGYHPPFFTILLSLGYLIQRNAEQYQINSLIMGFYSVGLLVTILLNFPEKKRWWALFFTIFITLISPFFSKIAIIPRGLDAFRISYFLLSFFLLREYLKHNTYPKLILMAVCAGAGLAAHSSGLLFFGFFLAIFTSLSSAKTLGRKYANVVLVAIIGTLVGGWQYVFNYINMGQLISDNTPIWALFNYNEFMRYERDLYSRQMLFKAFADLFIKNNFGYLYTLWIVLIALNFRSVIATCKDGLKSLFKAQSTVSPSLFSAGHLYFVIFFFGTVLTALVLNQELIIKNFRYMLTPFPFVMVSCFGFLSTIHVNQTWKSLFAVSLSKIQSFDSKLSSGSRSIVRILIIVSFYLMIHLIIKGTGYGDNKLTLNEFLSRDEDAFISHLDYRNKDLIQYLRTNLKEEDVIFAFDRNHLHSLLRKTKILFYLNDTLEDTYRLKTAEELFENLREKKVKYIFTPSYRPSILNQSAFAALMADPRYTTLEVNHGGLFLFKLNDLSAPTNIPTSTFVEEQPIDIDTTSQKRIYFKNLIPHSEYQLDLLSSGEPTYFEIDSYLLVQCKKKTREFRISNFTYDRSTAFRFKTDEDFPPFCKFKMLTKVQSKNKSLKLNLRLSRL